MRYYWENLPLTLRTQREALRQVIEGLARVRPLRRVILFGSHARGEVDRDSDVDLCILADGVEKQIETAIEFRRELRGIPGRPALTLIPITPERWREKQAKRDPFFESIAKEGTTIAADHGTTGPQTLDQRPWTRDHGTTGPPDYGTKDRGPRTKDDGTTDHRPGTGDRRPGTKDRGPQSRGRRPKSEQREIALISLTGLDGEGENDGTTDHD